MYFNATHFWEASIGALFQLAINNKLNFCVSVVAKKSKTNIVGRTHVIICKELIF